MKYVAMIQARCGSSRLPNKVMMPLCGKTVLERVIERVQKSTLVDEIVVITSIDKKNLPILGLCTQLGICVGVGSEQDVLDRYYQTAKLLQPEYVIRITADCPCFDSGLLDMAIRQMDSNVDYCGMMSETFADGLDLEIIKFSALQKAWREARHSFEREHVTQYIVRHPELFSLQDFKSPIGDFGEYRWTVDEHEDYELVKSIYEHFLQDCKQPDFDYKDILGFLEQNKQLMTLNCKYSRNEGLEKSMREDAIVKNSE